MAKIQSDNTTDELRVDPTSKAARTTLYRSNGEEVIEVSNLAVTTLSTANTTVTLTLPAAGTGYYHYITSMEITRVNDSNAAVAGTAILAYTTTNLPGTLAFSAGNALGVGEYKTDLSRDFKYPLKSLVANTDSTIIAPAGGANIKIRLTVYYYIGL